MTLVRFYCPSHGYLCDAPSSARVMCGERVAVKGRTRRCNKKATTANPNARRAA